MPPPSSSRAKTPAKGQPPKSKKKPAPKPPLSEPERIKKLFNSLCAQISDRHWKNAIKTCDKILKLDPSDADALQAKIYAMMEADQHAVALNVLGPQHQYERAYSLYKLQREAEARDILDTITPADERSVIVLRAQICYRDGDYAATCDFYNQLLDQPELADEQEDILNNLRAAQEHLDFISNGFLAALAQLPASDLEAAPPPAPPRPQVDIAASAAAASHSPAAATSAAPVVPKTTKVRARRVPKGVVPGVTPPPDPERWLKKTERSTYHTGKKRSRTGATQGAAAVVEPAGGGAGKGGKGKKRK
ncbi:hypothetical protein BD626DRAFT_412163 [Schizophyllum amplum]|uniref:Signal recognition particle subunit SRP72 n=1 Tax=Schizophyllum amplum TaxID=97359 RepID=A0A550BY15_9AGAR|nr:hypothetical protein BD626DRAFT_412163 [Auriculariopsis ampla]